MPSGALKSPQGTTPHTPTTTLPAQHKQETDYVKSGTHHQVQ
jgi:hypothetical protein